MRSSLRLHSRRPEQASDSPSPRNRQSSRSCCRTGCAAAGLEFLGAVQATGDLVATVVAGLLYTLTWPAVAFGYAAAWMITAAIASGALRRPAQ